MHGCLGGGLCGCQGGVRGCSGDVHGCQGVCVVAGGHAWLPGGAWLLGGVHAGFPLGLENLEKWGGIFQSGKSQGILNRLEKSGKITQNTGKIGEFEINII